MARTDILFDPDNIEAVTDDGSLNISESKDHDPGIELTPSPGTIRLRGVGESETVQIQSTGGANWGGKINLQTNDGVSAVQIDGGSGTLILGNGFFSPLDRAGVEETPAMDAVSDDEPDPVNGEVWLDDGRGKKYGLKANGGILGIGASSDSSGKAGLVLKPDEGVVSVVDENSNVVFEIDTVNKTIRMDEDYSRNF